ncbi:MAG: DNA replication protein DnaC, partial [Marivirga sp.]
FFYNNTEQLLYMLKISKVDGTYIRELKKLSKVELLMMDDFGLQPLIHMPERL